MNGLPPNSVLAYNHSCKTSATEALVTSGEGALNGLGCIMCPGMVRPELANREISPEIPLDRVLPVRPRRAAYCFWVGTALLSLCCGCFHGRTADEPAVQVAEGEHWSEPGEPTGAASGSAAEPSALPPPPRAPDARDAVYRQRTSPGWPAIFGPTHDAVAPEIDLVLQWPTEGPPEQWRKEIGTGYSAPVALGEQLVIFHRIDQEEILESLDPETGERQWQFRHPTDYTCRVAYSDGPYSTPVLADGCIYAVGAEGVLLCLDREDGSLVWQRRLHDDYPVEPGFYPVAASPAPVDDRLILNLGSREAEAGVLAIDRQTGATLWTATRHGASCATPRAATMHGRRFVFVWTEEALVSLDPDNGRVYWETPFGARNRQTIHGTSPVVWNDLVFVSGFQIGALCMRVLPDGSGEEVYRAEPKTLDSQYNNLVCLDGFVYGFPTVGRGLRCLELATGEIAWTWRSRLRNASSIAVGNTLLMLDERGRLATVDVSPEGAAPRSITPNPRLPGRCFTGPIVHRGLLYLRSDTTLACLDLRAPK